VTADEASIVDVIAWGVDAGDWHAAHIAAITMKRNITFFSILFFPFL
jgi:hypothetical protein